MISFSRPGKGAKKTVIVHHTLIAGAKPAVEQMPRRSLSGCSRSHVVTFAPRVTISPFSCPGASNRPSRGHDGNLGSLQRRRHSWLAPWPGGN